MSQRSVGLLVALAVLTGVSCTGDPMSPGVDTRRIEVKKTGGNDMADTIDVQGLLGTWQATKAVGTCHWDPNVKRDLVAEGGTVILVLAEEPAQRTYHVTLTMPGEAPRVNYGIWYCWNNKGRLQIDLWPGWIPNEDLEYGDGQGMYYDLNGDNLTLTDGSGDFLRYDFGWHDSHGNDWAHLELVLTRH